MAHPAAPARLESAFRSWIEAQEEAAKLVTQSPHPGHPEDWAEGYRWVTRIASLAQEWAIERDDPLRPDVFLSQGPTRKLMVDNPDVDYWFATLDPNETYRFSGHRGSSCYVGLTFGTDILRGVSGRTGTLGQYDLDEFTREPDGRFEITLARERVPGSWIALEDGVAQLAIRETFRDRTKEQPARYRIERLGDPIAYHWTPDRCADQLETAARFLLFVARTCVGMWQGNAAHLNRIAGAPGQKHVDDQDDEVRSHSATDMAYQGGRFALAEGEALRVKIPRPAGGQRYWGMTLVSPWMESYEYRYRRTRTNDAEAEPNADGSWTIVIAAEDPGLSNWLDTGGRREGFALIRWVFPATPPENPVCELVAIDR